MDKQGIFPSQKYFSEKGSSFEEKIILLEYFISTKQIEKQIVCEIFNLLKLNGIKQMSTKQIRLLYYSIEETHNKELSSATHLYVFPNKIQYDECKNKLKIKEEKLTL
jgi:hypothetical protein